MTGREGLGRGDEVDATVRMATTHRARGGRRGVLPSTWRATRWPRWDEIWAGFQADSILGPNMKFVHLGLLYIFIKRPRSLELFNNG
jgi:hypothetical protein